MITDNIIIRTTLFDKYFIFLLYLKFKLNPNLHDIVLKIFIRIRRTMITILNGIIVSRQNCIYCSYSNTKKDKLNILFTSKIDQNA